MMVMTADDGESIDIETPIGTSTGSSIIGASSTRNKKKLLWLLLSAAILLVAVVVAVSVSVDIRGGGDNAKISSATDYAGERPTAAVNNGDAHFIVTLPEEDKEA